MTDFTNDDPLATFMGGRYAQRPDNTAGKFMRNPSINVYNVGASQPVQDATYIDAGNWFATDTVTGEVTPLQARQSVGTGLIEYFDAAGAPFTPGADEVITLYALSEQTGELTIVAISSGVTSLTVPPNSRYAVMNVNGGDVIYSVDGTDPVDVTDWRVADGGRIELTSADDLEGFRVRALGADVGITVYFYNHDLEVLT